MTDALEYPEQPAFTALPPQVRGEIVLLLRDASKALEDHAPGSKHRIATTLKRIMPVLAEHGLDRWADLFWADAERLIDIADTPHARSQLPNRQGFTGSRLSGAYSQYGKWHSDQTKREEMAEWHRAQDEGHGVHGWQRGKAAAFASQIYRMRRHLGLGRDAAPAALMGLVKGAAAYLDELGETNPAALGDLYLSMHGRPEAEPRIHHEVIRSALADPYGSIHPIRQIMRQLVTYTPEEGIALNRDYASVADSLAEYSRSYRPAKGR